MGKNKLNKEWLKLNFMSLNVISSIFFKNYCYARKKNAITFPLKSNFVTSLNTFPFDITTLSLKNLDENIISS
jgi:hypothetical protein